MDAGQYKRMNDLIAVYDKAKALGMAMPRDQERELVKLFLMERDEIDTLMRKWDDAKALGMDLDERDKGRLLALLLTQVIRKGRAIG